MKIRGPLAASAAAAVALVTLIAFNPGRFRAEADPALSSRNSEAAVMARTRTVVATLWPNIQNIQIVPDLEIMRQGVRSPLRLNEPVIAVWIMVCEDAHGFPLGTITWNAGNGDLLSIVAGSATPSASRAAFPQMKTGEARKVMYQWISGVVGLDSEPAWQEVRALSRKNAFASDWRAGKRTAHLSINSWTGDLIVLRVASR